MSACSACWQASQIVDWTVEVALGITAMACSSGGGPGMTALTDSTAEVVMDATTTTG